MKLQLTVLSGGRAGISAVFSVDQVTVGRHPECGLQLHPEQDLDVSTRHALFVRQGPRWMVRDNGSRNGTLVNGHPIKSDTVLDDTDQVQLGRTGPKLEVRLVGDSTPDRRAAPVVATKAEETAAGDPARALRRTSGVPAPLGRSSTTQRIRIEVGKQTRQHKVLIGVLVVLLVASGTWFALDRRQQAAARDAERAAFQARMDSIIAVSEEAIASLRGEVDGLARALRSSQDEVQRLNREITAAEAAGASAEVERLRRELAGATRALALQQTAAEVDYRAIYDARNNAIAMIYTEFAPGDVVTGTAFAVTSEGVMITNRHVVYGQDGSRRPRRLAIQFANSAQVWRAMVVGVSNEADLAAVRVLGIAGQVPTIPVPGGDATVRTGDPIATIGFPGGTELPMRAAGEENIVRSTMTAGTISKSLPDLLQVDGYGAQGASGSPIFDASGGLVGVLYGGEPGSSGRVVYAVPIAYVTSLLRSLNVAF